MATEPDAGEELRRLRTDLGLLQRDVAEQLTDHGGYEVTPQAIGNWERGVDSPRPQNAQALERLYGTEPGALMRLYGTEPGALMRLYGYATDDERRRRLEDELAAMRGRLDANDEKVEHLSQLVQQLLDKNR